MRTDLSQNFIDAMEAEYSEPLQLLVFHFNFGNVYLSDRDITIGSILYKGLVEEWGNLKTASYDTSDIISETLESTITIWNGGLIPFSHYFRTQDPVDVVVDLYQTFSNLDDSEKVLLGSFVIQDPIEFNEVSRLLNLDLVSLNMRYTANCGDVLKVTNWPNALPEHINKGIDLIIGTPGEIKTLCAKTPFTCTMKGSILKLPTIINVYENLDTIGFPTINWYLYIDDEILFYSTRTATSFNVTVRGTAGTIAAEHSDGTTILQYINDHTYIIGQGPISSVSEVKAGGIIVDPSKYTLNLSANPARIVFPRQPTFTQFSKGARDLDVDFDSTSPNNGAYQPHYAWDITQRTNGALVSKTYTPLAVIQNTVNEDLGEIVRVFLAVEHWATKTYVSDRIDVFVSGIGIVGSLSRPNQGDYVTFSGNVDIDHGHTHETGGTHNHNFTNPAIATANPQHLHTADIQGAVITDGSDIGLPYTIAAFSSGYKRFGFTTFTSSTVLSRRLHVRFTQTSTGKVYLRAGSATQGTILEWAEGSKSVDQWVNLTSLTQGVYYIYVVGGGVGGSNVKVLEMTLETTKKGGINYTTTAVNANLTTVGAVALKNVDTTNTPIKDIADVKNLATINRPLENVVSSSSSKAFTERFDLTKYLQTITWAWLTNREVQLRYIGTAETPNIIVTYINFEVEYRQREVVITNDVTCKPTNNIINNRPDAVIQYLLNIKAGLPQSMFGSINAFPATWNDNNIWNDGNQWQDEGESLATPVGAFFEEAARRYQYLGYTLNGIISANETIQEAIKRICWQTRGRILWSAGLIKLAVHENNGALVTVKEIDKTHTQLRSVSVKKDRIDRIYNDIDIFYNVDHLSSANDESAYNSSISLKDQTSITKHGQKKDNSKWLFDFVRSPAMAQNLINYFIWRYGEPATKYSFNCYLNSFDLEKNDVIRFSSDFQKLVRIPLFVGNNERTFGSGKLNRINTINIIGDSVRHIFKTIELNDSVKIIDSIIVGSDTDHTDNDSANIDEIISISQITEKEDEILLIDEISFISNFNKTIDENLLINDSLSFNFVMKINENLILIDDVSVTYKQGFGTTPFGIFGFGSPTILNDFENDNFGLSETIVLTANYNLILADTVIVDDSDFDSSELFGDSAIITEELIFSSGFGAPVEGSSGFGLTLFGK